MPEFSAGAISAGAGSTTLPVAAIVGGTGGEVILREVGISNTTDVSCALKLARISTAGTPGTGLTEAKHNLSSGAAVAAVNNTYTSTAPTTTDDLGYRGQLAAAKGASITWVKGSRGIVIPATASAGIAILVENGTGQIIEYYFVWEE
jgi:hypothetical protein